MIIGISGRIGSGKDTVGKIIQYLVANENLPKDMQYQSLEELDHAVESYSNWQIKKFAGKLKTIASLLTGVPVDKFEDQEFKKTNLSHDWQYLVPKPGKRQDGLFGTGEKEIKQMSVREFLQKLGTEAMRDGLHKNVWVNALFADYKEELDPYHFKSHINESTLKYPNWILTDMRFPNEMEAVVEKGGITIRVVSPFIRFSDGSYRAKSKMMGDFDNEHPSETALDDAKFDYEIINDAGIPELIEKVRKILVSEKII